MATSSDSAFPFFEENNYLGWLFQFRAHLRRFDADSVLDYPMPTDVDENGDPLEMSNAERRQFNADLAAYKEKDQIAFPDIVKACYKNPKTKSLCETCGLKTAYEILVRLEKRFHVISDTAKAAHLLRYSALTQLEGESGADFVDREQRAFIALQDMGINVDDSLRLTKFIQQDCTNSKHKSLAQTIFTTPDMTLSRATSLFETYHPSASSSSAPAPSVNALFCRYCKKDGHTIQSCNKKKTRNQKEREKPKRSQHKNSQSSGPSKKKQRYPCAICDAADHLTHQCPRREEVKQCLKSSTATEVQRLKNLRWGRDEHLSDEEN
jgi:hypothetical protein